MEQERERLVHHILRLSGEIYRLVGPGIPPELLASDLTIAQLRVLLLMHTEGPVRMSFLASALGIALSTATGLVDRLVKKGLVMRDEDPKDRRVVLCKLSPRGQALADGLWAMGRFKIERLLEGLTPEQLGKAAEVAELLYRSATQENAQGGTLSES